MNYASFLASVDGLRSSLEERALSDERIEADFEKTSSVLQSDWLTRTISHPDEDVSKKAGRIEKIMQLAVKLWNVAVAKHAGKLLSPRSNAIVRQLCFDLASCGVINSSDQDKREIRRTIMMGIKVGKAWNDVGDSEKALDALETTKTRIDSLMKTIAKEGNPDWYLADKMSLQQDLLSVLCVMSEVMLSRGKKDEAISLIDRASSLPILSTSTGEEYSGESEKLCALTFNFGLKSANEQRYNEAVNWLGKSFDVGKRGRSIRPSVLGKVLRLLAYCYAEMRTEEADEKALNALELAKAYVLQPSGLHLKLKILARNNSTPNEAIEAVLHDLSSHKETSIELSLSACRYLNANNRFVLCEKSLENLLKKYANSPQAARIHSQKFEYTLHRLEGNEALDFAHSFLKDEHIFRSMDRDSRKCIHLLLWEQAEKCQEQGDTDGVLSWYDLSLRFHGLSGDDTEDDDVRANIAKIQRNRSSCMISLGRLREAKISAEESANLDGDNIRSDFTLFKIAVCEENESDAMQMISRLAGRFNADMKVDGLATANDSNATIHGLVCLCAQLAFDKDERSVAVNAFQHVAKTTYNRTAKLLALRCLVRLHLRQMQEDESKTAPPSDVLQTLVTENVLENALVGIQDALEVLVDVSNHPLRDEELQSWQQMTLSSQNEISESTGELVRDEAEWFMKISWNMGLESKVYPNLMKKLFRLCYEFLGLLTSDSTILTRQKTCLLTSCAAALEVARSAGNRSDLEQELRFALESIKMHEAICKRLHGESPSMREGKESLLLALYEFEARSKLMPPIQACGDGMVTSDLEELERLFEIILSMPQTTVKTLETIATLCTEPPANHVNLSKRALKTAIRKLDSFSNASGDPDAREMALRYGILYRTLVGLALQDGSGTDPVGKQEALSYVRIALDLVNGKLKKFYPEQECLWLTVKSWNIGSRLYVSEHILEAEKWCSSAMGFLVHLKHYKSSYETHMTEIYQEILAKKNSLTLENGPLEMP